MITYLVSGESDIEGSSDHLRATGRTVRHGEEFGSEAFRALVEGGKFVVVAHGDETGTVFYCAGVAEPQTRWLWVGMVPVPARTRVYLYCCKAGPAMSAYLSECECFGHSDVVPIPAGEDVSIALDYLSAVDELMLEEEFGPGDWRKRLRQFVASRLDEALSAATETNWRPIALWNMLARSLN